MRKHVPSVPSAAVRAAEQLLLTIGRAGVLSSRAIAAAELETLLRLLGPPSERQRGDLKRATDIVLIESGASIYWPRTGEQFHRRRLCHGARASDARMSTAALKRELALLRSSLAALKPSQSATLDDPIAWAERIAGLTLDPWQRDVLLSAAPRLLLNATRQSGKRQWPRSRPPGRFWRAASPWWSRRRCDSPASCSESSPATLSPLRPPSGARRMTEVELVSGGLAVSLPGDRPAMLRGLSLRHEGPAVLLVDEASRVRDELWATISPMLAAAPAAQQILLSTPAGASGEFHRAWNSGEDWERVQITADQCPRISAEHLAAERIRLGDALYRQEYRTRIGTVERANAIAATTLPAEAQRRSRSCRSRSRPATAGRTANGRRAAQSPGWFTSSMPVLLLMSMNRIHMIGASGPTNIVSLRHYRPAESELSTAEGLLLAPAARAS